MQQSSATQSLHLSFWGLRKIVACSHSSSQCLLVSTVFGTVSSLHPTSFLMIFILVLLWSSLLLQINTKALSIVSYIGLSFSSVCLIFTIIFFLSLRYTLWRSYVLVITPPRVIYQPYLEEGVLWVIYSLAPSERIDTGKTWPVCAVRLRCYALLGVVHA